MITRYRNKALKRLGISFALLILAFVLPGLRAFDIPKALIAVGVVILGTSALVFYIQGNIALAKAKGHDSSVVGAVIIVASLCIGGIFFAMPLILYFGLDDKNKAKTRLRNPAPEPTTRNSPAKLPPLRKDDVV